jgi:hypothetical protein
MGKKLALGPRMPHDIRMLGLLCQLRNGATHDSPTFAPPYTYRLSMKCDRAFRKFAPWLLPPRLPLFPCIRTWWLAPSAPAWQR